jgi:preprotein translocase subunit SecE
MATEEDLKKAEDADAANEAAESSEQEDDAEVRTPSESPAADTEHQSETEEDDASEAGAPVQLGYMRFVYAAYMAGAMIAAFLVAKIGHVSWYRLGQWKPEFGEPRDELIYPLAGVVGVLASLYYWRKVDSRQYATEVAEELSKVTWPNRKEVTNSTFVVIMTTLFATVFFALMDQFWKYVTDKIYSF